MAIEKKWASVLPQSITSNGTSDGTITVLDSSLFKVKQKVKLFSDEVQPFIYQIKRIPSSTTLEIGGVHLDINNRSDLSAYLAVDNSKISAEEQERPAIIPDAYNRAVYEEEPTVAIRNVLVDSLGNKYSSLNPVPIEGAINIDTAEFAIQLDDYTTANVMYIGYAIPGSLSDAAVWAIKKIDFTSGIIITWADGNANSDNIWDNRSDLDYA